MTRPDTRVWHEPLGDPFYFSSKRQCLRYTEDEAKKSEHWDKDIVDVMQSLLDPEVANKGSGKDAKVEYIFIKVSRANGVIGMPAFTMLTVRAPPHMYV
jgi:hypothetical protein